MFGFFSTCSCPKLPWEFFEKKTLKTLKLAEVEERRILGGNFLFCGSPWVGFYIVPPCEADCLVVVEAVDEDKNNIQHLAVTRKRGTKRISKKNKNRLKPWEVVNK